MSGPAVLLAQAAGFLVAMLALSAGVARDLPSEGPVPVHFDIRGNADGFGSRWLVLGLIPGCYVLLTGLMLWIGANAPSSAAPSAELLVGHGFASAVLLAAHGFIGFLLLRWARRR